MQNTVMQNVVVTLFCTVALLSTSISPAFAQDGEPAAAAATTAPAGIGVLILLIGLAAILFVGGYYVTQSRPAAAGRPVDEDEDDQ